MATGQDKLDVPFIAFVHFALIVVAIGQGQHGREQFKDISSGMKTIMLTACPTQAGACAAYFIYSRNHDISIEHTIVFR